MWIWLLKASTSDFYASLFTCCFLYFFFCGIEFAASLLFVFMPCHKLEVLLEKEHKAHLDRATFSFQDVQKTFLQRKRIIRKKQGKENESNFWGLDAAEWRESFDRGVLRPNWRIRGYLLIYQANDSLGKLRHCLPASSEHQTEESAGGSPLLVRTRLNIRPSNEVKCERMQETLKSMGWQGWESIYIN